MDSIIDTALAGVAGTVVKDLEPAAVATLQDLKGFVHGQADRLRTALPVLEQKALEHVRSISAAVLAEYDNVLARIDSHLAGAPAPSAVESDAGSAAVAPVDPTQAPSAPTAEASSVPSSAPSENSGTTSSATVATPTTDTPAA